MAWKPLTDSGDGPFKWWLFRGEFSPVTLADVPADDWHGWEARYENDCERHKRACRDLNVMPERVKGCIERMNGKDWLGRFGVEYETDPTMHGGGLHVTYPGGWLSVHLDYAAHPILTGKERRLNLIAFLNPEWRPEWGGALLLCDDMGRPAKEIYPEPGMVAAFETHDRSYHGVSKIADDAPPRVTAAVYYLSDLRPNVTRKRALFIPNRGAA